MSRRQVLGLANSLWVCRWPMSPTRLWEMPSKSPPRPRPDVTLRPGSFLNRQAESNAGASEAGARLLPLKLCEAPRDRALGLQGGSLIRACCAWLPLLMPWSALSPRVTAQLAGVEFRPSSSSARPRRWGVRSPRTRNSWSSRRSQTNHWRQRCTLGWMVQVCPYSKRSLVSSPGLAARRLVEDARAQARNDLERRGAGQRRHARARRGVDHLLVCDRKRCRTKTLTRRRASSRLRVELEATWRGFERAARQAVPRR